VTIARFRDAGSQGGSAWSAGRRGGKTTERGEHLKRKIQGAGLLVAALTLVGVLMVAGTAGARVGDADPDATPVAKSAQPTYIVRMLQNPVVAYEGGIAGLKATAPAKGTKIDSLDADVVKYVGYLKGKHDEKVAKVGAQKIYDYAYSFNGFAAKLNPGQVAKLEADPDVLSIEKTRELALDTATTPAFLGLTSDPDGLWFKGIKGENVVIGILDTGVWPESKSFTDRDAAGKLLYQQMPKLHIKCASTDTVTDGTWDANLCNRKLVGAQFYCASRGCDTVLEHEFVSPRDYNGHGTHTASTAGGNQGVPTTGAAAVFGSVNGIAPRARISAYKIGWDNGAGSAGANTGDVVAAVDQAVADGVDVINYSFSGTQTNYLDAVEIAYLFAGRDGVFVATSAGNSGPTASTVAHISPWLASVAAGTHNRNGTSRVTLGNGAFYDGASLTNGVSGNVVLATASGLAGADPNQVRQCFSDDGAGHPVLDPAKIAGKIVVCERGGAAPANARVDKSLAVKNGGGIGMILYNVAVSTLNADLHWVPSVHVNNVDGAAIVAYVNGAGASATASWPNATIVLNAPAPDVASFSSRGPSLAGGGDILKPDFMAPGVDIVASVAPPGNGGKDFDVYSGTSMSSPHVAGIAALLTQAHRNWSPAAMRSAIATTADALSRAGLNVPFNTGSGHVRPNLATDPGLVYDASYSDYLSFLQGQNCQCLPASIPAIDASDLNQPSIAIGDLAGAQTVTRKVTNLGSAATYNVSVAGPAGFTVAVNPTTLSLAAGETKSYTVTITRTDAPFNTYRFGSLTWSDGSHNVRSPIIVRPVALAAPAQLNLSGTSGSTTFTVKTGYAGTLNTAVRGLIPATTTPGHVNDDPANSFSPTGQGVTTHPLTIPAGTTYARISLFDEFTDGEDDLDLYVYLGNTLVGASGGGTAAEEVNLVNPAAGNYTVYVHGWETDGPDANYTLFTWVLGSADAGNATISPASTAAGVGTPVSLTLNWSGLTAGTKYLGSLAYSDGTNSVGRTIVRVDS
jgi:subtilisin family serine protease